MHAAKAALSQEGDRGDDRNASPTLVTTEPSCRSGSGALSFAPDAMPSIPAMALVLARYEIMRDCLTLPHSEIRKP